MRPFVRSDRGQERRGPFGESPEGPEEANDGRNRRRPIPDTARAFGVPAAAPDAVRVAHPARIADPRRIADPGRITTNGDMEMMISSVARDRASGSAASAAAPESVGDAEANSAQEAQLPFAGYDRLDASKVVVGLSDHSQIELEAVESYERSHNDREAVLNKLRYLRGSEPFPGYDAMSVEEILAALEEADLATIKRVRGYERKFGNRARVLDEVVRVHRARRTTEPASVAPAYQPISARSGASRRGAQKRSGL
jgi:hypothetical protein